MRYCPNCKSLLQQVDEDSMELVQVCSYCTSYIPKYKDLFLQAKLLKEEQDKKKGKRKNTK